MGLTKNEHFDAICANSEYDGYLDADPMEWWEYIENDLKGKGEKMAQAIAEVESRVRGDGDSVVRGMR